MADGPLLFCINEIQHQSWEIWVFGGKITKCRWKDAQIYIRTTVWSNLVEFFRKNLEIFAENSKFLGKKTYFSQNKNFRKKKPAIPN